MTKQFRMNTYTGVQFYPFEPAIEDIKTEDIGHALSHICRGNGHVKHFYSVAQHSLNCSLEAKAQSLSERVQLACLLHDASEAYIADITRPVKQALDTYLAIEHHLQHKIYEAYGLGDLSDNELSAVDQIDDAMLHYEMEHLLDLSMREAASLVRDYDLSFRPMEEVKQAFIERVNLLTRK